MFPEHVIGREEKDVVDEVTIAIEEHLNKHKKPDVG